MQNFAAIDFETANQNRCSVCSVGVVIYRNGQRVDDFYSLIKPIPNFSSSFCVEVHGLTDRDTRNAKTFPEVWAQIEPLIGDLPLVAHNKGFDENCLKQVFDVYGMDYPDYKFYCTLQAARSRLANKGLPDFQLHTLADYYGIELNHHHALSDAEACAYLALKLL